MRNRFWRRVVGYGSALAGVIASGPAWAQAAPQAVPTSLLPKNLSVGAMFHNADPVVQVVLVGLLGASVVTWTVLVAKGVSFLAARRSVRLALGLLKTSRIWPACRAMVWAVLGRDGDGGGAGDAAFGGP